MSHSLFDAASANGIVATAAVLATIALLRSQIKSRREEKYQAEQLVQVVLRRLQDQVSPSVPYLFPAQGLTALDRNVCIIPIQ